MTKEEQSTFERDGLLYVEDALSPEQVEQLTAAADRVYSERRARTTVSNSGVHISPLSAMVIFDFISDDERFIDLVDYGRVLPKVWGILGWNIYLYHAHLIVTPPSGQAKDDVTWGWHQDSYRLNHDIETHPRPRLSLKVAYFLSDTSVEDRGNFWVVPGSHLDDDLERPAGTWANGWHPEGTGQPAGATPVLAKPGTAVLFDRRLWHAASDNWSDITRKVVFYGYSYRWVRRLDDMNLEQLWDRSSPIRRQLLGYGTEAKGHYSPSDADVPLRAWLEEHDPAYQREHATY